VAPIRAGAFPRRSTSSLDELSNIALSRFVKIQPLLVALLAASVAACTSIVRDLSLTTVTLTRQSMQGRGEPLLSVEVTTRTSLEQLRRRWDDTIRVDAHFCDQASAFAVLSRGLYVAQGGQNEILKPLWEGSLTDERPSAEGLFTYTILLNIERKESLGSVPPQVAFDLVTTPRAVCFHLAGGYFLHSVTSNVVQVSSGSIAQAVARYRDSRGVVHLTIGSSDRGSRLRSAKEGVDD